jgi:hypothetical protein
MSRDQLTFRQRDLKAAIKAVTDGGLQIARIEVRKDGILIVPGPPDPNAPPLDRDSKSVKGMEQLRREIEKKKRPGSDT